MSRFRKLTAALVAAVAAMAMAACTQPPAGVDPLADVNDVPGFVQPAPVGNLDGAASATRVLFASVVGVQTTYWSDGAQNATMLSANALCTAVYIAPSGEAVTKERCVANDPDRATEVLLGVAADSGLQPHDGLYYDGTEPPANDSGNQPQPSGQDPAPYIVDQTLTSITVQLFSLVPVAPGSQFVTAVPVIVIDTNPYSGVALVRIKETGPVPFAMTAPEAPLPGERLTMVGYPAMYVQNHTGGRLADVYGMFTNMVEVAPAITDGLVGFNERLAGDVVLTGTSLDSFEGMSGAGMWNSENELTMLNYGVTTGTTPDGAIESSGAYGIGIDGVRDMMRANGLNLYDTPEVGPGDVQSSEGRLMETASTEEINRNPETFDWGIATWQVMLLTLLAAGLLGFVLFRVGRSSARPEPCFRNHGPSTVNSYYYGTPPYTEEQHRNPQDIRPAEPRGEQ